MDTITQGNGTCSNFPPVSSANRKGISWFKVDSRVINSGLFAALLPSSCSVLATLWSHADKSGRCWPSVQRLGELTGYTARMIFIALKELEKRKLVKREPRPGRSTLYTLLDPPEDGKTKEDADASPSSPESPDSSPEPSDSESNLMSLNPSSEQPEGFSDLASSELSSFQKEGVKSSAPTPEIHCTPLPIDEQKQEQQQQKVVVASLTKEGIKEAVALKLAKTTTLEQINIAARNADELSRQGRLLNRPGYIRRALEESYEPLTVVQETLIAEKQLKATRELEEKNRQARLERERQSAQREQAIEEMMNVLTDREIEVYIAQLKAEKATNPYLRKLFSDPNPRESRFIGEMIYEFLNPTS